MLAADSERDLTRASRLASVAVTAAATGSRGCSGWPFCDCRRFWLCDCASSDLRFFFRRRRRDLLEGCFGAGRLSASALATSCAVPIRSRTPSIRRCAVGVYASADASSAAATCVGCSRATLTSLAAFSSCRWPREFVSAPRSRFASGRSALARRSCSLRVARASRQVQRATMSSGASTFPSPIARRSTRTPWTRSFSHVGAEVTIVTRSSKSARSTTTATRSPRAERRRRRFGFSAAQLMRKASRHSRLARASFSAKAWRSSNRTCRPAMRAQRSCSSSARRPGLTRSHSRVITVTRRRGSGVTGTSQGAGESFRLARRWMRRRGAGVTRAPGR